ncbi:MAG: magnesium transporter [Pyramidobacter sp.]|nr:magnesium transporter [Pyramidobacter sp.]
MSGRLGFSSRLRSLLQQGKLDEARGLIRGFSPEVLKEEILRLPPRSGLALCSILRPAQLSGLIESLSRRERQKLLSSAAIPELRGLFMSLPESMLPELFSALPSRQGHQLADKLPKNIQKILEPENTWPEDSVGYIMSTGGVILSPKDTVADALEKIRRDAPGKDQVYHCFVNDGERFLGTAALEDMVLAAPNTTVEQLTEEDCHAVAPETDRAEAARIMSRYDVQVLPVVKDGRLLGSLPFDDVLDVMEDENTEFFHHTGGLYGDNDEGSLWGETLRRFPCLLLCLVTGVLTTGIIENYESLLSQVMALSFFVSLLIDTGGNVSGQVSVLIIRAMGLGSLPGRMFWKVLLRELVTGVILGGAMAALAALRSVLLGTGGGVTFVVGISMICVVMLSNMLGAIIPFIVKKTGFDPALISGPLLATINDVVGLALYFSVASFIL